MKNEEYAKNGPEVSISQVRQRLHQWPVKDGDSWTGALELGNFPSSLTHFHSLFPVALYFPTLTFSSSCPLIYF